MIKFLTTEEAVVALVRDEISVRDLGKTVIILLGNRPDSHKAVSKLTADNPKFLDLGWDANNDAFEYAVMAVSEYIVSRRGKNAGVKAAPGHVVPEPRQCAPATVVTTKPTYIPTSPFAVCKGFSQPAKVSYSCPTAG